MTARPIARPIPYCDPVAAFRAFAAEPGATLFDSAAEAGGRGVYCGTILWVGFDGAMDSNIVIRTLVVDGSAVVAQAGGGIVADSDPEAEYRETMDKAWPLLKSLDPGEAKNERAQ